MGQNGNISYFLTNVSNSQVFVQVGSLLRFLDFFKSKLQSPACNIENKWHYATVVKVPSSCQLKIFSDDWFQRILVDESNQARQGALNQGSKYFLLFCVIFENFQFLSLYSVYDRTFNLSRLTAIRASFVKGWGRNYRRSVISRKNILQIFKNFSDYHAMSMLDRASLIETTEGIRHRVE